MRNYIPNHFGNEEKMVIVDPNGITPFILADNNICEGLVDGNVMLPTILFPLLEFWIIRDLVVKCRPDDLLAIAIVMTL